MRKSSHKFFFYGNVHLMSKLCTVSGNYLWFWLYVYCKFATSLWP